MEEEVLGKAYDARLMRRLLAYLRPYKLQVAIALAAIILSSVLQLAQPWLMKVAIDDYIARGDLAGMDVIALGFLAILLGSFALEYLQTWVLQMTGQRIMREFVDEGSAADLDTSCISQVTRPAFFLSPAGPDPSVAHSASRTPEGKP